MENEQVMGPLLMDLPQFQDWASSYDEEIRRLTTYYNKSIDDHGVLYTVDKLIELCEKDLHSDIKESSIVLKASDFHTHPLPLTLMLKSVMENEPTQEMLDPIQRIKLFTIAMLNTKRTIRLANLHYLENLKNQ